MTTAPLLDVTGLHKNFGGVQAISDLTFELAPGELLGIIGPNGSGKTTAVNLITGFVKPSSGKVLFKGQDITGQPAYKTVTDRHRPDVSDGQALLSTAGLQKYDHTLVFAPG